MIEAFERVRAEVRRVVVGQEHDRRPCAGRGLHRRARAARRAARRRQDAGGQRARAGARAATSGACSSRPTCCPPTSPGTMTLRGGRAGASAPARCSRTSCSPTRSTARRRRPRRRCWRRCRSARSRSTASRTRCPPRSSCCDAEPDRVRGHLPAAGGAARPLPLPHRRRLSRRGGRAGDAAARPPRRARALARAGRAGRRRRRPARGRAR